LALVLLACGFDGILFFSHLDNLCRHYLAASAQARCDFDRGALGLFAGLFTLLVLARLPLWIERLKAGVGGPTRGE
jgi:hypothetical protein